MARAKYIDIIIGGNVYKVPTVHYPEVYDEIAILGSIVVKLHQRVEELEMQVDDIRSIVGYGDEL